jgi:hypothetical protein
MTVYDVIPSATSDPTIWWFLCVQKLMAENLKYSLSRCFSTLSHISLCTWLPSLQALQEERMRSPAKKKNQKQRPSLFFFFLEKFTTPYQAEYFFPFEGSPEWWERPPRENAVRGCASPVNATHTTNWRCGRNNFV